MFCSFTLSSLVQFISLLERRRKYNNLKMKTHSNINMVLILIVQCIIFSGNHAMLNLFEDDVCQQGDKNTGDSVCKLAQECSTLEQDIRRHIFPPICSFIGNNPVVCCSPISKSITTSPSYYSTTTTPFVNSYTSDEMCRQYSKLVFTTIKNPMRELLGQTSEPEYITVKDCFDVLPLIAGGDTAHPKEFPHMALIGYGNRNGEKSRGCGGSLISKRWILSAAHCANNTGRLASWVRLGNVNILSEKTEPNDYKIVERVLHPHYNPAYIYNDIALFRLERDVKFSPYVRPICLNTDPSLTFDEAKVCGWGRTSPGGPTSPNLLRTYVKPVSIKQCKEKYPPSSNPRINLGILEDSMICAGDFYDGNDTCAGDSGGPLQIDDANNTSCVYTLVGITSFGKHCGSKDTPGVYTKVSNYIPWIEQIVWPKN